MCFSYAGHLLKCPFYLGAKILKIMKHCSQPVKKVSLLASKTLEIYGDIIPRLEGVTAKLDECRHAVGFLRVDEIVAIEQAFLTGEDGVTVGGHIDIFIEPREGISIRLCLCRSWGDKEELVSLQEHTDGFLRRTVRLAPLVSQRINGDVDDGPLTTLLQVVNPADDRYD